MSWGAYPSSMARWTASRSPGEYLWRARGGSLSEASSGGLYIMCCVLRVCAPGCHSLRTLEDRGLCTGAVASDAIYLRQIQETRAKNTVSE